MVVVGVVVGVEVEVEVGVGVVVVVEVEVEVEVVVKNTVLTTTLILTCTVGHADYADRQVSQHELAVWSKMDEVEFRVRVFNSSMLFNNIPDERRVIELEKYARKCDLLISLCAECHKLTRAKKGFGVSGISHSLCGGCMERQFKDIASPGFLRGIRKAKDVERFKDDWFEGEVQRRKA